MAWLYRQKKSRFWWLGWRVGKQPYFRSTKTVDRKKAELELAKVDTLFKAHKAGLLDQVYQSISGREIVAVTVVDAVNGWLEEVKHERGDEATFERYEDVANGFLKFLGASPTKPLLSDVTSQQMRQYTRKEAADLLGWIKRKGRNSAFTESHFEDAQRRTKDLLAEKKAQIQKWRDLRQKLREHRFLSLTFGYNAFGH